MFSTSVPRIFKTTWKVSMVESLFSKVTEEMSAFHISVGNTNTCISMFWKVVFLEISISSLLTGVEGLTL